jgi:hypothetical protein
MHSGRVGGGKRGVGKAAFLQWREEPTQDVMDSSRGIRKGVVVMPVEGVAASRSALRYIDSIATFKRAARNGELKSPIFKRKVKGWKEFYSEPRGRRKSKGAKMVDYVSRHGEVVDALRLWRTEGKLQKGERLVKSILIDMGIALAGKLVEVFEVKTSAGRFDVYAAIGQLLVHGTSATCRRAIVLPKNEALAPDLLVALKRMSIELLRFKLDAKGTTILSGVRIK